MKPFNPLAMENLAESIVHALHLQDPVPLALVPEFDGAGVYALYYHGKFPAYKALAAVNADQLIEPIYIGKASPSGARKEGVGSFVYEVQSSITKESAQQ